MNYKTVNYTKPICRFFHSKHGDDEYWYCRKCGTKIKKRRSEKIIRRNNGP